jgi:putative transposase
MEDVRSLNHTKWECKYQHFWARGYFVTTVGADEETIRDYIRRQETEDRRLDQLGMFEE